MIFETFSQKMEKKLASLTRNKAKLGKNLIMTFLSQKTVQKSQENSG
jgi:hypothetical protein